MNAETGNLVAVPTLPHPQAAPSAGIDRVADADLVVVGAGAKAAAIASKVHAINSLGIARIRLTIVEATEVAATWSGVNGYTSGGESLAITPAKDVGFPYESVVEFGGHGPAIDSAMIRFSWQQYLVGRRGYARWIDAGSPPVQHREYGAYLTWVLSRATEGVTLLQGRVSRILRDARRWLLDVDRGEGICRYACGALLMTGPGVHREISHDADAAPRMFHCDSRRPELARIPRDSVSEIAIVGGGESALSSVLFLRDFRPKARLTVYTPTLPMSRGESFLENRVFSTPDSVSWELLPAHVRREFVKQCDRGVFGPDGLAAIAYDERYRFVMGRVTHVEARGESGVAVRHEGLQGPLVSEHDYVVNCTGFDLLEQLRRLVDDDARREIERSCGPIFQGAEAEPEFGRHLELRGLRPRLHIPGLAGVSQGPGFANLGCLGVLANRVLAPLVAGSGRTPGG